IPGWLNPDASAVLLMLSLFSTIKSKYLN
ncbi:uncharacterized protein METZ01_LOCUS428274, partial [marine metagenome]